MEGMLLGGSMTAAFVAGMVALFAPCCILVVFPAYLAAAVRNQRWRLVPLTLVFAAGLSVVLVPAALGVGLLTRSLLRFHGAVYVAGGLLLLALAAVALSGRVWSLPMLRSSPDIRRTDSGGVFALGVFSGAASACCAPVLAGVLTLTAVAPGLAGGAAIALAYVLGMVAPLLALTLAWDRTDLSARLSAPRRRIGLRIGGWRRSVPLLDAVAAAMFAVMGLALIALGATGSLIAPTFQLGAGLWVRDRLEPVAAALAGVPDLAVGLVLVAAAVGAVWLSSRSRPSDAAAHDDADTSPDVDPATSDVTPATSTLERGRDEQPPHCHD